MNVNNLDTPQNMLQFNNMFSCYQKRGVSSGFSLIELLTVLVLIGIIGSLLIPKLLEAKQESLRQAARQQTKLVERALADWFNAQPTIASAVRAWYDSASTDTCFDNNNDGYAIPSRMANELRPYLVNQSADGTSVAAGLTFGANAIYSEQMKQIEGGSASFIGSMTPDNTLGHAHLRLFWQKDDSSTTNINERTNSSPKVVLFLPST